MIDFALFQFELIRLISIPLKLNCHLYLLRYFICLFLIKYDFVNFFIFYI
jgi:hypothetical protein